jgi:hypothetical protein
METLKKQLRDKEHAVERLELELSLRGGTAQHAEQAAQEQVQDLLHKLSAAESAAADSQARLEPMQAEKDKLDARIVALQERVAVLQGEGEALRTQLGAAAGVADERPAASVSALEAQIQEHEGVKAELARAQAQVASLQQQLAAAAESTAAAAQVAGQAGEGDEMQEMLEDKEKEIEDLTVRCHELMLEKKKQAARAAEAEARLRDLAAVQHEAVAAHPDDASDEKPRKRRSGQAKNGGGPVAEEVGESTKEDPAVVAKDAPVGAEFGEPAPACAASMSSGSAQPKTADTTDDQKRKRTLKPLPAKALKDKGEEPVAPGDKENDKNGVQAAGDGKTQTPSKPKPEKKARKLFNAVQMPDDVTGNPFDQI